MKKSIILTVLVFIAISGYSQIGIGIGSGGMGVGMSFPIRTKKQKAQNLENKVQQMRSDLNLDSAQIVQVRSLLVERERRNSKDSPMPREEFNKRMAEILTLVQKERFKELHHQRRGGKTPPPPPANNPQDSTAAKPNQNPPEDWDDVYN
jgi:hypothetical protein